MLELPLRALRLLLERPRLLALGVFPGVFTLTASGGLAYLLWERMLRGHSLWLALPALLLSFLASWLVLGRLALLPVEDAIVDECQRALWGEVRLPAPPLTAKRFARESLFAAIAGLGTLGLFLLELVPGLALIDFVLAAWVTAYAFLSPIYLREEGTAGGRLRLFFRAPMRHFLLGAFLNFLLFVPLLDVLLLGYAQVLAALVHMERD